MNKQVNNVNKQVNNDFKNLANLFCFFNSAKKTTDVSLKLKLNEKTLYS